ncbi:MAG: NINE protein [Methyloprofundus sp.]|nr:NINE protein [Methyloprofundus sp.]
MIGTIESYTEDTQTGVIKSEEQFFEFHIKEWSEPVAPIIDAEVLFEGEEGIATMVTLIGSYLEHEEPVKSRKIAIALALFPLTGAFGGQRWYLGYTKVAIFQTIFTIVTIGFGLLWPMVDGFLLYSGALSVDKQGRPLK